MPAVERKQCFPVKMKTMTINIFNRIKRHKNISFSGDRMVRNTIESETKCKFRSKDYVSELTILELNVQSTYSKR